MCGQRQKASIYNIYTHIYIYIRIYAISAWSSREQNQLKRRFKTCVCQNWFVSAPAKYPFSYCLPCGPWSTLHGSSIPQFPIQHGQFSSQRHMQKKKKQKKAKHSSKNTQRRRIAIDKQTVGQTDRQTGEQTQWQWDWQQSDSRTTHVGSVAHQHTLRHTPAGGKQSQLGGCTRYEARVPRHGGTTTTTSTTTNTSTTSVARIGGLVLMAMYVFWRLCQLQSEKKAEAGCDLCVGCETSNENHHRHRHRHL